MSRRSKHLRHLQSANRRIAGRRGGKRDAQRERRKQLAISSAQSLDAISDIAIVPSLPLRDGSASKDRDVFDRKAHGCTIIDQLDLSDIVNCEVLLTFWPELPAGGYQEIEFGDVLNRVSDPLRLLRRAIKWLAPDGTLTARFNNACHIATVGGLLAGKWQPVKADDNGQTTDHHLRVYTRREIEKLFFRAGYQPVELRAEENLALARWRDNGSPREVVAGPLRIHVTAPAEAKEHYAERFVAVAMPAKRHDHGLTSIVIVTFNQLAYTRMCLESIRFLTDEPYELIIVDNASTDGTVEYLRSCSDVKLIENAENRGFPSAANQGMLASRGQQVLFLNNDIIATTGWLKRLLSALHSDPRVGLVGPCSNYVSGPQQVEPAYHDLACLDGWAWEHGKQKNGHCEEVDRLVGFCLLVRREVLDTIGLFDERFGIGNFEDDDLCHRAIAAGWRAVIARDAYIHHFGHRSFAGAGVDLRALLERNQRLYNEKWRGAVTGSPEGGTLVVGNGRTCLLPSSPDPQISSSLLPGPCRLSCCMIARDNERTIATAVKSILPWVDELIVVDTGSKDRTPEICRQLGCKVYQFPWPDSFSVARNESLKQATGEWIVWFDTDDELDAENGRKLRELLSAPIPDNIFGFTMQVHCPPAHPESDHDAVVVDHCKVFRNRPDIRFEGRIHEQVLGSISRAGGEVLHTSLFVVHAGADHTPAGRRRKLARDFKLLRLELKEQPGHTFTLFNLGMTFADSKKYRKAVRALERSLVASHPGESHVRKIYALLVSSLKELGRAEEARRCCQQGLALFPKDPELHFRSGLLYHDAKRLRQAEQDYLAALANDDETHFASLDRGITGYKTRQNLAVVYAEMGALHKAEHQFRKIVEEVPSYRYGWQCLADNLLEQGRLEAADALADQLFGIPFLRGTGLVLAGQLAERRGNLSLARQLLVEAVEQSQGDERPLDELCRVLFFHGAPDEAEAALTRLVRERPDDAAAQHNLAVVYLRQGRPVEATLMFRSSLQLRPNSPPTAQLLACAEAALAREQQAA